MTDNFSRFTKIRKLPKPRSTYVWKAIKSTWINYMGKPDQIISDRGSQFTAEHFRTKLTKHNIQHIFSSTANPTSNGIVERANATVGLVMRLYKGTPLKQILLLIERRLNQTYHRTLESTPWEIIYGKIPNTPSEASIDRKVLIDKLIKKHETINETVTNRRRI